jgi:hypothetical protein
MKQEAIQLNETAENISTSRRAKDIGRKKVKHLMGIMNRPLVTTSVSII